MEITTKIDFCGVELMVCVGVGPTKADVSKYPGSKNDYTILSATHCGGDILPLLTRAGMVDDLKHDIESVLERGPCIRNASAEVLKPYDSMVKKMSWSEFRDTGLLLFVNHFLHIFGWSIVVEVDDSGVENKSYPARVKFRGFDRRSEDRAFSDLSSFMKNNADELLKECEGE